MGKKFVTVALVFVFGILAFRVVLAEKGNPTVLFSQGLGQKFLIQKEGDLQLSKFARLFADEGFRVTSSDGPITDETLKDTDVVVISGAFTPLTASEIDALLRFVERGGSLCVMLHVPQPLSGLMSRLQIFASNGVIREREHVMKNEPKEFFVRNVEKHPITSGVEQIGVHGGWALMSDSKDATIIARTSSRAWIDLDRDGIFGSSDAQQSFGVAIAGTYGKGRYVVFGDDAIFQNVFLEKENTALAKNLVKWLKGS